MTGHKSSENAKLGPFCPQPKTSEAGRVSLGGVVRVRRLARGLTLQQLADQAGCAKSYLSMVESGARTSPPGGELLARLETILHMPPGELLGIANWHNTPAPIRRRVEALEGTRRAAVVQLRELLDRGAPRASKEGPRSPSMVLDELWRTGKLQSLVDRLAGPDEVSGGAAGVGAPTGAAKAARPAGAGAGVGAASNISGIGIAGAEIPLINAVAAGYPRDFTDLGYPARVADNYVRSPDVADPDAFACRVFGDSMMPEYREGDIVIFSPARTIKSGMDCFVRLEPDHESTFKRVFFEEAPEAPASSFRLQPLNPNYPARMVDREQVAGMYAAVSVTRKLG